MKHLTWPLLALIIVGGIAVVSYNVTQSHEKIKMACIEAGGAWIAGAGHCIQ